LDRTYAWIYAEPELQSVVSAVKKGLIRLQTEPLSWPEAIGWWATALRSGALPVFFQPSQLFRKLFTAGSGSTGPVDCKDSPKQRAINCRVEPGKH
jgi:hypothetical protein